MTKGIGKTVTIIGLGYVGLPLAVLADKKGYNVIGIIRNQEKADLINKRICPFKDEKVQEDLKKSKFLATLDFSHVKEADTVVICVPTPVYESRLPNYEPVESATRSIAPYLKKGQLIILESTVNPGVCEELMLPILEGISGLKCGQDFYLAHCPERINPGDKKWNVSNIPRVVGGCSESSLEKAYNFYKSIISGEIKKMASIKEAEACKVVENSFRNINIAFVNELARSFAKLDIDVVNVINGAATKPFSFMAHYPGCGIGGHCIPVDPYYLIDYAKKKNGFDFSFLSLSCKTNEDMPAYTVGLAEEALKQIGGGTLGGQRVTVLGLSYKANIDDCRESPSFEIIKVLKEKGADVITYDPYVLSLSSEKTLNDAIRNSKIIIIATDHREFKIIDPDYLKMNDVKIVIDGRNCLDKDSFVKTGLVYRGIGR